jgi:AcrR family transcriptional regulator
MARPKSEKKRAAILSAAVSVISKQGLSASTSSISRRAGIAEGTLFMYFPTKKRLINELYRELKKRLSESIMVDFPTDASVTDKLRHIWGKYIGWGVSNSSEHNVLKQIEAWAGLTEETRRAVASGSPEVELTARAALEEHIIRDLPPELVGATIEAIMEATIGLAKRRPEKASGYISSSFDILRFGLAEK